MPFTHQTCLIVGLFLKVGDTWMYGAPSDPLKMMQNREIQRAWIECLETGAPECDYSNKVIQNMTRMLMKAPEVGDSMPTNRLYSSAKGSGVDC